MSGLSDEADSRWVEPPEGHSREEQNKNPLLCVCSELITDLLGSDKYRLSLETMLESLQDQQINK